jgi:hypothetical protein
MKYTLAAVVFCFFFSVPSRAQEAPQKLKVFIDCTSANCDYTFMRTEINLVDFFLDRIAADVHVLITQRQAGSGGAQFQMIFYGQKRFAGARDTLTLVAGPNATAFEQRDLMVQYLKLGLAPFIGKTAQATAAVISMKVKEDSTKITAPTKDKWNYWIHNVGADGWVEYNKNYLSGRYGAYYNINRITDKLKVSLQMNTNTNFKRYTLPYADGTPDSAQVLVKNSRYSINQLLVKTIADHWSYGYELKVSGNSFTNYKNRTSLRPAIEYNFFKYSEINTKFLVLNYGVEARRNTYFERTIYLKESETAYLHSLRVNTSVNQKWGSLGAGVVYRNYLHDFKLYNLGINMYSEVRITGGLSFYVFLSGNLVHDQIYLPLQDASSTDVITQQRQLASSFAFYSEYGINYRFGTKLNNFVNPAFTGRSNNIGED